VCAWCARGGVAHIFNRLIRIEEVLQIAKSRRPDSNWGPLHYER
jgi:hypothetical protein